MKFVGTLLSSEAVACTIAPVASAAANGRALSGADRSSHTKDVNLTQQLTKRRPTDFLLTIRQSRRNGQEELEILRKSVKTQGVFKF